MEIFILLALILLNGLFSMSEIALVSARKARLEAQANKGDGKAKAALELANHPDRFLSTVQIGITLIGILTGIYAGDKLLVNWSFCLTSGPFCDLTAMIWLLPSLLLSLPISRWCWASLCQNAWGCQGRKRLQK
jgi:CBS domain containing-hemolysin-like protein